MSIQQSRIGPLQTALPAQTASALEQIISQHFSPFPMPSEELRLHVGAKIAASNFLRQGLNSSRKVISLFGEAPTEPCLDWGCGTGRTLRWLLTHPAWQENYRGVDVDAMAIHWLQKHGVKNVKASDEHAIKLPYETDEMGGVFSFSVLNHIPPKHFRAWFEEIARVIRPGGLAYLTFNGDSIAESKEERHQATAEEFRKHGLAWLENEGNYKSAAFVTHDFIREISDGIFKVKDVSRRDYGPMDALIAESL